MPTDSGLAALSNSLLLWAIVVYALAMTCYAIEYAFGAKGAVAVVIGRSERTVRQSVLVGAGEVTGPGEIELDGATREETSRENSDVGWIGALRRAAIAATVLGALCQVGSLIARGAAAGRVPWGNMYEFICVLCLVGVVSWLVACAARPQLRHLGVFVLLPVVLLLGLAGTVLYAEAAPLVPALNSVWLKIHVSAAATASGIFLFGFVCAVLYLIRQGYDTRVSRDTQFGFPFTLGPRLPAADSLERLTFRVHALAFPLWTFAVIAGAIWAEAAWTRYWGWDPKETWAFISWVVYAAYLHARATAGWRGKRAAFIVLLGWATMMVNLFVINLVQTGLHSYAGV